MKTLQLLRSRQGQRGYVLVASMALMAILLGTGLAFMRWAVDESDQSQHAVAGMQAYYLAQLGVIEGGMMWLKTQQAGLMPGSDTHLSGASIDGLGFYDEVVVGPVDAQVDQAGNFFIEKKFRISAVGHVQVPWTENGRPILKTVSRKAILYVQVRSFSDYMYLTDFEDTVWGETVRFFNGDTLWGRTHSNSRIHIMQSPVFYDIVSTGDSDFGRGAGFNPVFHGPDPWFNAPEVYIPILAENIRDGAAGQGHFYGQDGMEYLAQFNGSSVRMWEWEEGAPFDSTDATIYNWPITIEANPNPGTCIFVDKKLSLYGTVDGAVTIGSSQTIYLLNDIKYACCAGNCITIPDDCNDYIGIVSENNVVIANTPANGRNNSSGGAFNQPNQNLTSIVITAAIVALDSLDGSFTFEQQNDGGDWYQGPFPDSRGRIHLNGSVTQRHRGYVHRSNHGSTGYLKNYHYDNRLKVQRPPCFFDAKDNSGHALFKIIQWGQLVEDRNEMRQGKYVRYN